MDLKLMLLIRETILDQRKITLKHYGFDITCEPSDHSDFKYSIKNDKFSVSISRDNKDEIDTISQIITYLFSTNHNVSLTKKELEEIGIESISSLHCTNILGLEESKLELTKLYMILAWLKQSAEQQWLDYDTAIFADEQGYQKQQ